MEDNKRETPFVYNIGDRLKYIHGKGEMITVVARYHQYNKETGTTENTYLLNIEDYEGYGYMFQDLASEKHMMANMRRVYSPKDPKAFLKKEFNVPKDTITEAFDFTAKYMKCREDDCVMKEFFDPKDFEKKSNDALSCGYYKALEEENKKLKEINDGLRRQLDIRDSMLDKTSITYKQWTDTLTENKIVKDENEALKMENEELRDTNEGLARSYEKVKKENEKLWIDNKKLACAEKQLDEAAKRIYEAREHLSMILYNK